MKNIVRLVATFAVILLTGATPALAERDLETGVFLSRDPAGFVDGPNLYSYVRQNPWSKFDPEGLSEFALGYDPAILTPTERAVISGENKKQVVVGSVAVVAVGATVVAPQAYAYVLVNPGSAYAVTEAVTTAGEIATGYDGPPIIPGPGDILRAEVQATKQASRGIVNTAKNTADEAAQTITKQSEKLVDATKKPNLNHNDATSNFGLYEIETPVGLEKVGKADLERVTQSSGLPTRLHQQVRKLEKTHGQGNVKGTVVEDLGRTTTAAAKAAENARIKKIVDDTGKVPPGNQKSYKP